MYKVLNMEKAFKIQKILETMIKNDNLHKNEIFQRKRISIYYYLLIIIIWRIKILTFSKINVFWEKE